MRHLAHLAARFLRSLIARRPGPDDQVFVADHLDDVESRIFWSQPVPDLDHALRGARWLSSMADGRRDLVRAFLLHDVGKRHSLLGTWGRSIVTAASMIRVPVGARGRSYLDHARLGAEELEELGVESLVATFARDHHRPTSHEVAAVDWHLLREADRR